MIDNYYLYYLKEHDEQSVKPICSCDICNRGILYMETYFDVYGTMVCDDCIEKYINKEFGKVATD